MDEATTVYLAILAPGHYQSMDWVGPVRAFATREEAERYTSRRPRLGVIAIDPESQSAPWRGHDLDAMHRG